MNFISTKDASFKVGFKEAVSLGLAPDGGLFVPEYIPKLNQDVQEQILNCNLHELAYQFLSPFIEPSMDADQLRKVIHHAFSFDIPLKDIPGSPIKILELFHGPTWAFKDVGARFLAACLNTWMTKDEQTTVLVATSGDTGGAVANGFLRQQGIQVVILYPKGKITSIQEQQIAGLGSNITSLAVEGSFDDCQALVKKAFNDRSLRDQINLASANSINIARWLPQMVFYAWAWKQLQVGQEEITLCVPSGNYGNISAAFISSLMGISFKTIMAAHNANDTIPRYLQDGKYQPHPSISTLANAMDVSDPNNFPRLQYLLRQVGNKTAMHFKAESVADEMILQVIRNTWDHHQYLLDPHSATAWHVLTKNGLNGIVGATAHPFKFEEVVIKALGFYPDNWRKTWKSGQVVSQTIPVDYTILKNILKKS